MDLFTAGVLEETLDGALLGPTFACIIGAEIWRQVKKIMKSSSYYVIV
jgi:hypothetical protein